MSDQTNETNETNEIVLCECCADDVFADSICDRCNCCAACCDCTKDVEELAPCPDCGELFPVDVLERGLCPDCLSQRRYDAWNFGRSFDFLKWT